MSRRHSGNFRAKHPADTTLDESVMRQVAERMINGRITCESAHAIASALAVAPAEVGTAIDLQNGRIEACQLGLFGYGKVKPISPNGPQPSRDLASAVEKALVDGRLSCSAAWQIARLQNTSRLEVGRACETWSIKIGQCQLGAF
jgi:hypothetical protein